MNLFAINIFSDYLTLQGAGPGGDTIRVAYFSAMCVSAGFLLLTLLLGAICLTAFWGTEIASRWSAGKRFALVILSVVLGAGLILIRVRYTYNAMDFISAEDGLYLNQIIPFYIFAHLDLVLRACLPFMTFALLIKLYEKLINGRMSAGEMEIGLPGIKAWLSRYNVIMATVVTLGCWMVLFEIPGFLAFGMTFGAILVYPVMRSLLYASKQQEAPVADISPERERVMKLLESGKITSDDAAELLGALAATVPQPTPVEPINKSRKIMLAGAAVVLVAFFMPWFSFNPVKIVSELAGAAQQQMINQFSGQMMVNAGMQPNINLNIPRVNPSQFANLTSNMSIDVAGGSVSNGLGWILLICSLTAALLPFIATGLSRNAQTIITRTCMLVAMLIGLYLLTSAISYVSYGLLLALLGLGLECLGLLQGSWNFMPASRPVALPSQITVSGN